MKMFEEWWANRELKDYLWGDFESHDDTWRTALEWTLRTLEELDREDAPISMREVIEQELEAL